jgi:hypothetical protein
MRAWLRRQFSTVEGARNAVLGTAAVIGTLGFLIAMGALNLG